MGKRASHRDFRVAHFDDENASGIQMRRASFRIARTASMPSAPGGQRQARLMPVFRGQRAQLARPDIGRVADNDIVALGPTGR